MYLRPQKSVDRPSKLNPQRLCCKQGPGRTALVWEAGSRRQKKQKPESTAPPGWLLLWASWPFLGLTGGLPAQSRTPRGSTVTASGSAYTAATVMAVSNLPSLPTECGAQVGKTVCKIFFLATPHSLWDLSSL